nr:MAG TPA: hypothetical protein [Caudoviricetes sp.]
MHLSRCFQFSAFDFTPQAVLVLTLYTTSGI